MRASRLWEVICWSTAASRSSPEITTGAVESVGFARKTQEDVCHIRQARAASFNA